MKTYLFDTINRYKRWSEQLDMKAKLCNKSWLVFNDNGENEKLVFLENGTLVSSNNGVAIQGTWQFISATQSLVILYDNKGYMTHPVFGDNSMLILQLDGSNVCTFLLDENKTSTFLPTSIMDIARYVENQGSNNTYAIPQSLNDSPNKNLHYMDAPIFNSDEDYDKLSCNEDNSLNIPTTVYSTDNHIMIFWEAIIYMISNYHWKDFSGTILSPDGRTAKLYVVNGQWTTMEIYHPNGNLAGQLKLDQTNWGDFEDVKLYNTYGIRLDENTWNNKFYPRYEAQINSIFDLRNYTCFG